MKEITRGLPLNAELSVTLQGLLDEGIENYREQINEISDYATREQNLEYVRNTNELS